MDLFISFIKDHHFHFDQTTIVCKTLKQKLSEVENIPSDHFSLQINGRFISGDELIIDSCSTLRATLCHGLKGGKGGFGAMLRKKAKEKGPKKTVDFGACRDLSGRRIRHVNDEIILKKWQEAKDRGEAFNVDQETPSGINLWFLPTPTWTEGFGKKSKNKLRQSKRKTTLCSDWMEAHGPNRRVPKNAPIWWGCPRGNRCDYAHGEGELESTTRQTLQESKKRELVDAESEKLNTYLNPLNQNNSESSSDDIADLVMVGLSKTFKRPRYNNNNNSDTTTITQGDTISNINNSSSSSAAQSNLDTEVNKEVEKDGEVVVVDDDVESDSDVEDELKLLSSESHCDWLQILAGDAVIMEDGAVLGQNDFSTVIVRNCQLVQDAWYYEVELLTDGLMQIGWACVGFQLKEEGDGVGDDLFSWSYDGYRCKKWHVEDTDYGSHDSIDESDDKIKLKSNTVAKVTSRSKTAGSSSSFTTSASKIPANKEDNTKWKTGDVLGCYLELIPAATTEDIADSNVQNQSTVRMVFYKNGSSLREAFSFQYPESNTNQSSSSFYNSKSSSCCCKSGGDVNSIGFFPALSVDSFQQVVVNIGQTPFKHRHQENVIEKTTIFKTVLKNKDQSASTKEPTTGGDDSNSSNTTTTVNVSTAPVDSNGNFLPLDLESDDYNNIESLEYLGANCLKFELMRRGLKFGGTVEEKAKRLFSVRGVAEKDINIKLKAATIGVIKTDVKK